MDSESRHQIPLKPIGVFKQTHPPVFLTSAVIIFGGILGAALFTDEAGQFFKSIQSGITTYFSWLFTLTTSSLLLLCLFLLFSRFGGIRLGKPDDRPEFDRITWFAMLFSAGMGIGLVFWSIAEPINHFMSPPSATHDVAGKTQLAMRTTYFHWGFHAWAIYCTMGLALALFSFRHGLPLTIRSLFYPLLKKKIFGPIGNAIDILAVVSTLFGVATSLGLGAMQVNAGLNFIAGVPNTVNYQVLLIALITAAATTSVVLGLVKGISRLSKFNIWMSLIFLLFVFISGPTGILVENLLGSVTDYLIHLPALGVWSETGVTVEWRSSWTTFYWAWWIAWSPFVGMFIARVSKGRTLREFVIGVLLAPCLATFVWLGVFGGTALHLETAQNIPVAKAVSENVSTALFFTLNQLPLATVSASLAVVVIITFFVTSSDSGSLVIDIITAGGAQNPPVNQRVFWAVTEGVAAMTLLMAGGLKALQAAAIATGLPFSLVLLAMCVSLIKALNNDPYLDKTEN